MEKKNYEGFSLSLALVDALPVLFFGTATLLAALKLRSAFFVLGAVLCTLAGLGKVTWKIILAAAKKDVAFLKWQLRIIMPPGFVLLILGAIKSIGENRKEVLSLVLSFPSVMFFSVTALGMVLMCVFAVTLDQSKARSNWIEQITNAVSQCCFLLGVCFCL